MSDNRIDINIDNNFDINNYTYDLEGKILTPKILKSDCDNEMVKFAYDCAFEALEKFRIEKFISEHLKQKFDEKYNKSWHCVVGDDFSVCLTHDSKYFLFFSIDKYYFLLFKL